MRRIVRLFLDAYWRFNAQDGWAIASHIALSALTSLFPFLIFVTAMAGFVGSQNLADEVATLVFSAWPPVVAQPIARELHNVLAAPRGGLLTIGAGLALYFSSGAVEAAPLTADYPGMSKLPMPWKDRVFFVSDRDGNREIYVMPVVNADGYVYNSDSGGDTANWRKNRRCPVPPYIGIDLNRNFGYKWGFDNQGSTNNPWDETYRGPSAFSEPEAQAARNVGTHPALACQPNHRQTPRCGRRVCHHCGRHRSHETGARPATFTSTAAATARASS